VQTKPNPNMRKTTIYYKDLLAGILTETDDGDYIFQYDEAYVKDYPRQFITFSMPVVTAPFKDRRLFPFLKVLFRKGGCWISLRKAGR
jgi:serine/threonine-protein kinase HipA